MKRTGSWIVAVAAIVGSGALVAACSAVVSPDTSRLRPGEDGGGLPHDGAIPPDGPATCPDSCSDDIDCTLDTCVAASCQHMPQDAQCAAEERCSPTMGCIPLRCTNDGECSNGNACDGAERCDPASSTEASGCVPGMPVTCDDGFACTDDACDPVTGACLAAPVHARCDDGLACTADACAPGGPGDGCTHTGNDALCDDGFCNTGGRCDLTAGCVGSAPRDCDDADGCDIETCDPVASMCVSAPRDADGDGHAVARAGRVCAGGDDCDDTRADVYTGAPELCANGRDDDCDGTADEGCTPTLNDTCATATPIAIDPATRTGTAMGSYSSYRDDVTTRCSDDASASGLGRDAWYYFDVTTLSDVVISTTGAASQDTVLAVAFDCGATPIVCNDDQDPGSGTTDSRIFLHRVGPAPGSSSLRVYVLVDSYDGRSTGGFRVDVRTFGARADSCAVEPLDISGGGTVLGVGPFGATTAGQYGSCQSFAERAEGEAVLRIRPPGDNELEEISAYSTTFTPDLYVRSAPCSSGTERVCERGAALGGGLNGAQLSNVGASSGTNHFLFVDGMVGTTPSGGPHSYVVDYDP